MDQIKPILSDLPVRILTLEDAGIGGDAVEDGATLEENALKKARFAWEQRGAWSIADDTGLFIDALSGQPGIRAARWAGEGATTEQAMRFALERLREIPEGSRTATFKTAAVVVAPDGRHSIFVGMVKGAMLREPRVACQLKMPYSAIFVPDGQPKVWAEMSTEEENVISHRGKAFRQLHDFLRQALQ